MIDLDDFQIIDKDGEGVYLCYLKGRSSLDIFKKEIADKIWNYSEKINDLIYIGRSDTVYRRIYANHLQGVGASTLRETISKMSIYFNIDYINNLNLPKDINIYSYWLDNYTYFKIYKVQNRNESQSIENSLIGKYDPIFNGGYDKVEKKLNKIIVK